MYGFARHKNNEISLSSLNDAIQTYQSDKTFAKKLFSFLLGFVGYATGLGYRQFTEATYVVSSILAEKISRLPHIKSIRTPLKKNLLTNARKKHVQRPSKNKRTIPAKQNLSTMKRNQNPSINRQTTSAKQNSPRMNRRLNAALTNGLSIIAQKREL